MNELEYIDKSFMRFYEIFLRFPKKIRFFLFARNYILIRKKPFNISKKITMKMYHIKIVKKVKKHKNYEIRNKDDKFLKSAVTTIKQYIFDEYKSSSIAHIPHIKLT